MGIASRPHVELHFAVIICTNSERDRQGPPRAAGQGGPAGQGHLGAPCEPGACPGTMGVPSASPALAGESISQEAAGRTPPVQGSCTNGAVVKTSQARPHRKSTHGPSKPRCFPLPPTTTPGPLPSRPSWPHLTHLHS